LTVAVSVSTGAPIADAVGCREVLTPEGKSDFRAGASSAVGWLAGVSARFSRSPSFCSVRTMRQIAITRSEMAMIQRGSLTEDRGFGFGAIHPFNTGPRR
jgi:hypothetical protein